MMCHIGEEIQKSTGAIALKDPAPSILDLCAAPGGFMATALRHNKDARICGISLPKDLGGHPLLVPKWKTDPRVTVNFLDITMLGTEFGMESCSGLTPTLSSYRPYHGRFFDLVFCDGQVLRTHAQYRDEKRESLEAPRLSCSQMILALQRLRQGGTLIMLMHKVESWHTLQTLRAFSSFATVQLHKPHKYHTTRGSFYLVATNVQPASPAANAAISTWKAMWREATVGTPNLDQQDCAAFLSPDSESEGNKFLEEFGDQVIRLGEPVWDVQRIALAKKSWN
ncbi:hypothetical protein LTR84_005563 [Exophiala bonariae]|uniref:Ribosomal RNA methyltransferase FtsJ domain-containing protein n=1 Tax=Exophiala bonariae TaxID=1690606 RepID=A0AAV9N430_9EURO|nr:hypothetical protein LTR84_005563 [Exophiala bonariae]